MDQDGRTLDKQRNTTCENNNEIMVSIVRHFWLHWVYVVFPKLAKISSFRFAFCDFSVCIVYRCCDAPVVPLIFHFPYLISSICMHSARRHKNKHAHRKIRTKPPLLLLIVISFDVAFFVRPFVGYHNHNHHQTIQFYCGRRIARGVGNVINARCDAFRSRLHSSLGPGYYFTAP